MIPEDLQRRMAFFHAPPRAFMLPQIKYQHLSGYAALPTDRGPFDFVLVDGPSGWLEDGQWITLPNGDLFFLVPHISPKGIVYVDSRKTTFKLYRRYLQDYFTVLEFNHLFSILERTDKPLATIEGAVIRDTQRLK